MHTSHATHHARYTPPLKSWVTSLCLSPFVLGRPWLLQGRPQVPGSPPAPRAPATPGWPEAVMQHAMQNVKTTHFQKKLQICDVLIRCHAKCKNNRFKKLQICDVLIGTILRINCEKILNCICLFLVKIN
jgi:hypothetical protein